MQPISPAVNLHIIYNGGIMALIRPDDDDLSLPELPTSPLWARSVLALLLLLLLAVLAGLLWFELVLGDGIRAFTSAAVLCEQVEPGQAVFRLVAADSEVRYQVDENLLKDNTLGQAVGRTQALDGYLVIDFTQPHKSQLCDVVVNVSQLDSGNPRRDRILRVRYLNTLDYPEARFKPQRLLDFPDQPQMDEFFSFRLRGDLTIKGKTASATWNVRLKIEHDRIEGSADTVILMSTYGVGPVNMAGFVQSSDDVQLRFDFVAQRVNPAEVLSAAHSGAR